MNHMKIVRDKNRYNFPAQKFGRVLFVVAKLSSLAELKDITSQPKNLGGCSLL